MVSAPTATAPQQPESTAPGDVGEEPAGSAEADQRVPERGLFAALAAHELREPVHAIQSYLSVILRERVGPLNAVQRDFLTTMQQAGRRLERLIDDVQLMVTHEQGFPLRPEPTDLLERAAAACRELAPTAEGYGLRLSVEPSGDGPWGCVADPARLDQVLLNLVENALRYALSGTTVRVQLRR